MKIYHLLFILVQLLLAFLSRDQNRIAYLRYLLSAQEASSPGTHDKNLMSNSHYRKSSSEVTSYEYALLLER